jgi:hypothetical protein
MAVNAEIEQAIGALLVEFEMQCGKRVGDDGIIDPLHPICIATGKLKGALIMRAFDCSISGRHTATMLSPSTTGAAPMPASTSWSCTATV